MAKRILIVEDNPMANKIQKMIVENLGFEVDSVMTGEDGVDLSCQKKYDLILMDLGLPGIDGLETTKKIKMQQSAINNQFTPVVAVTANEDLESREQCFKVGMEDVFSKPFTPVTARTLLARYFPEEVM